jgi:long-chain acyl-CoA synthetase
MLYDRWREVAQQFQHETALLDASSGQRLTFQALAEAADREGEAHGSMIFPQGLSVEFVLSVLRGWRNGQVVYPLEPGQKPTVWKELPTGCVHLKSTSASTGAPRVIAFTAEQLEADVANIVATMGLQRAWPNLSAISLAHSYGFSNLVLPLLLHGIPLVLIHAPLPEMVRRAAGLVPDLTLAAVPTLWRAWLEAGVIPGNIRLAISAGAPLPLALELEVFTRHGLKIHNFYGASECGGIAYDKTTEPRADGSCVGSPLRNVGVELDGDGCLVVRGAAVGLTYWPEPATSLVPGCYRTSDIAEIGGDSILLRGRQTDQINVAGRKISPESIERVLASHPEVRECLVFGAPSTDSDRTEMIVACVATRSNTSANLLRQYLLAALPAWQVPRDWWFVPSLQADQRGKVARGAWRKRYLCRTTEALRQCSS